MAAKKEVREFYIFPAAGLRIEGDMRPNPIVYHKLLAFRDSNSAEVYRCNKIKELLLNVRNWQLPMASAVKFTTAKPEFIAATNSDAPAVCWAMIDHENSTVVRTTLLVFSSSADAFHYIAYQKHHVLGYTLHSDPRQGDASRPFKLYQSTKPEN